MESDFSKSRVSESEKISDRNTDNALVKKENKTAKFSVLILMIPGEQGERQPLEAPFTSQLPP